VLVIPIKTPFSRVERKLEFFFSPFSPLPVNPFFLPHLLFSLSFFSLPPRGGEREREGREKVGLVKKKRGKGKWWWGSMGKKRGN
jgi:hypothetical protein